MDDKDGVPSAELHANGDNSVDSKNGSKKSSSSPDPLKCAASELASFLLKNRFENDAVATASFLLECTASLPNADEISARLMGGGGGGVAEEEEAENDDAEEEASSSLGEAVPLPGVVGQEGNAEDPSAAASSSVEVSGAVPRCKFDLSPYEHGIVLTSKKGERVTIGSGSVAHVAMFPKPEDCRAVPTNSGKNKKSGGRRKRNGSMVLIALRGGTDEQEENGGSVSFRNKVLKQVCFQLPQYEIAPSSQNGESSRDAEDEWAELLQSSLLAEGEKVIRVANPAFAPQTAKGGRNAALKKNPDGTRAFRSDEGDPGRTSVTTGGMPYVKCYHGVNDGVVYPLEAGLLFFKPPLFVHRSKLHSISCGRGSSSSGSRYVDLVAVLEDGGDGGDDGDGDGGGERIEFSNINREETRVLNDYIHGVLVTAMARDAADDDDDDEGEAAVQEVVAEEEDGEAADDEDDDVPGRRKRSRRPASQEARAQIAALEAKRAAKAPQSGDDHEEEDLDDVDDPEDYCADDDDESDDDEDGFAEDAGVPMVEEESDEEDEDEEDADFDGSEDDDEETESETEEEEAPRPKKKAKKASS